MTIDRLCRANLGGDCRRVLQPGGAKQIVAATISTSMIQKPVWMTIAGIGVLLEQLVGADRHRSAVSQNSTLGIVLGVETGPT